MIANNKNALKIIQTVAIFTPSGLVLMLIYVYMIEFDVSWLDLLDLLTATDHDRTYSGCDLMLSRLFWYFIISWNIPVWWSVKKKVAQFDEGVGPVIE